MDKKINQINTNNYFNHSHWKKEFNFKEKKVRWIIKGAFLIVGVVVPVFGLYTIANVSYKLAKCSIKSLINSNKNKNIDRINRFDNNFNLKISNKLNKEMQTKINNVYAEAELKKDLTILEANFNDKNGVFETYEYDKKNNCIIKNKIFGMKNGEWKITKLKMSDTERNYIEKKYGENILNIAGIELNKSPVINSAYKNVDKSLLEFKTVSQTVDEETKQEMSKFNNQQEEFVTAQAQ